MCLVLLECVHAEVEVHAQLVDKTNQTPPSTPPTKRAQKMDSLRHFYLYELDYKNPKYSKWLSKCTHPYYVSFRSGSPASPPPKDIGEWVFKSPTKYIDNKCKVWRVDLVSVFCSIANFFGYFKQKQSVDMKNLVGMTFHVVQLMKIEYGSLYKCAIVLGLKFCIVNCANALLWNACKKLYVCVSVCA